MSQRIEHFSGTGFQYTVLDNYSIPELQQAISSTFAQLGWGVQTFTIAPSTVWSAISLQGAWFNFDVLIDNSANLNPETIRAAVQTILSQFMTDVTVNYVGSDIYNVNPSTGQTDIVNAYNDKTQQSSKSLWDEIFGSHDPSQAIKTGTISFTTIAIILGVGYVLISSRRK